MRLALAGVLATPSVALAAAGGNDLPRPAGWIGTTEQWTQGLGIVLAALNLLILFLAWRALRRNGSTQGVRGSSSSGSRSCP